MLCKRTILSALAVVAAVGCVSAAPQNFDLEAILGQFTAALPGINTLINDPAFLASISKQMGAFNDMLAKNPGLMSDILNGKIPTELINGLIPTDLLDDLKPKPTSSSSSKPKATPTNDTKPDDDKPAKPDDDKPVKPDDDKPAKPDDDKPEDDKPEKPSSATNLKPVAGMFIAGVVAVAALF